MCASTTAKVAAVGWFLTFVVAFPYVGNRYPEVFPGWLPSWAFLTIVAAGFVGSGLLLKGLDLWRWHRLATSMGLQRMGNTAADKGFNPIEAYRGEFEGRQVMVDHIGNQSDVASNWTRVAAQHDGDTDTTVVVRERGLGGAPDSEFPPSVDVQDSALTDRFHVYCEDAEFARAVLTGHVRERLVAADNVDQVKVGDDTVISKQRFQPFDTEVVREHMRVATEVAGAVESESHRTRDN